MDKYFFGQVALLSVVPHNGGRKKVLMINAVMRIKDKGGVRHLVTREFADIVQAKNFCEACIGQDVKMESTDPIGEHYCEHILLTDYATMETVNYEQDPPMWI